MAKPPDTGRAILDGLITQLTTIRRLPKQDRIQALVPLLDRSSDDNAETRLAAARSHAARDAAREDFDGNMTALAQAIGVTPQRISSLIAGVSSRKTASRRRAATKVGAVGE